MTRDNHNELVARLATSNISTEDFSYLTKELMESRTCENCKWDKSIPEIRSCGLIGYTRYPDFGCNKFERKEK